VLINYGVTEATAGVQNTMKLFGGNQAGEMRKIPFRFFPHFVVVAFFGRFSAWGVEKHQKNICRKNHQKSHKKTPLAGGKGRRRKRRGKKTDVPTYLPFLRFFDGQKRPKTR
jgi:hypothetical protein